MQDSVLKILGKIHALLTNTTAAVNEQCQAEWNTNQN